MFNLKEQIKKILLWSQKYTKTDMVYLTKGSFWLIANQVLSMGASFILSIIYANFLSKDSYGVFKYILSLEGTLSLFSLTGLTTALTQAVAKGQEGSLKFAFNKNLKYSVFYCLAAFVGATYYFLQGNQLLAIGLLLVAVFSPLIHSAALCSSYLSGKRAFKTTAIYSLLKVVILDSVIILIVVLSKNTSYLITGYFITTTIISLFIYRLTTKKFPQNELIDRSITKYSIHLSLINIISSLSYNLDSILVFHYINASQLAIYSFAIILPEQIRNLLKNISDLALPKFSEKNRELILRTINKKIFIMTIFAALVAFSYIFLSPFIYQFFFPQYLESVPYSQVYSLGLVLAASLLPYTFFTSKKAVREQYIISFTGSLLRIPLLFILILRFGLWGAVLGKMLPKVITNLLTFYLIFKEQRKLKKLNPTV